MKKFLTTLVLMITFSLASSAQVQWYKTTAFAQARIYNGSYVWSDWEHSNMNIAIDIDNYRIIIYSPVIQIYDVIGSYNNGNAYRDSSGGQTVKFYVIDQDGDRGEIRLRIESNGNSQIYIDFADIAWVYNVIRNNF